MANHYNPPMIVPTASRANSHPKPSATVTNWRASQNKPTNSSTVTRNEDNLRDYECPVCLNILRPPTLLCQNGHFVCSKCRHIVASCPVCSAQYLTVKNTTFDDILGKLQVPCIGSPQGCTAVCPSGFLDLHEKHCQWLRKTVCCVTDCKKSVRETEYCSHIEKEHTMDIVQDISKPITVNFNDLDGKNKKHKVMFVREKPTGQILEIHIKKNNGGFQVAAKQSSFFAPGLYEVVYNIGQNRPIISITKQLYSAQVRREVMFDNPHLSIDDDQSSFGLSVVVQKSKPPEPVAVRAEGSQKCEPVYTVSNEMLSIGLPFMSREECRNRLRAIVFGQNICN